MKKGKKEEKKKRNRGRPTKYGQPMVKWSQYIPVDIADWFREIGTDAIIKTLRRSYDTKRI